VAPAPFYYLLNFNDFASSLVVLFQQMVVNNWFVVVNMTVALQGGGNEGLYRLFFISFWVVVVLILVNITVAIVIEVHGNLSQEVQVKFKHINTRNQLHKLLKDDNELSMREKLLEADQVIQELQRELAFETVSQLDSLPSER